MTKIAIVGGGLVGSGIATLLILSNYDVIMKEVNEDSLSQGIGRVKGEKLTLAAVFYSPNYLHMKI